MQGGKHSAAAYSELEKWMYGSIVANAASFVVSAGTGMLVNISTGAGLISDTIARRIGTDAVETATVPTASASFNRIDTVLAYIDTSVTPSTGVTDNTNDILKFVVVAGTAASTPVAPTGAAIISAIGAGKPYMVLYDVLVPQNATNTSGMTFTDRRVLPTSQSIADAIVTAAKIATSAVTTAKVATNAITGDKLATNAILLGYADTATTQGGITTTETDLTGLTITVTVPAGGRSIKISASTWLSSSAAGDTTRVFIKEGSTYLGFHTLAMPNVFGYNTHWSVIVPAPSAGSHTYKLTAYRQSGSGTIASNAGAISTSNTKPFIYAEMV